MLAQWKLKNDLEAKDVPHYPADSPVTRALFSPQSRSAMSNLTREYAEGPLEIDEEHLSNDPDLLRFQALVAERANAALPITVDDYGRAYGNGVRSNFNGLRQVSGYPMIPSAYPVADNSKRREDAGLASGFVEPWHRNICTAFIRALFSDLEPCAVTVPRNRSSSLPLCAKDTATRMDIVYRAMANAQKAGAALAKGDFERAWLDYDVGGASLCISRIQNNDAILFDPKSKTYEAKRRESADLAYALSGGYRGSLITSSKSLEDSDAGAPTGFFRLRKRLAFAIPLGINAILAPITQAVRAAAYRNFGYVLHHTTDAVMETDIRQWSFSIAIDVSQHDQLSPNWYTDYVEETLLNMGYPEWWVAVWNIKSHLPYYVSNVGPGEPNVLIGDWRAPSMRGGVNSGNAGTDIDGMIFMTPVYIIMQIEHTARELISKCQTEIGATMVLQGYMQGTLDITGKHKGDDALLGWKGAIKKAAAQQLQEKMRNGESVSPYMNISYEHGAAMLGRVVLYPADKDQSKVSMIGNITSLFLNLCIKENGVQRRLTDRTKSRNPFPYLGWETLIQAYGSCPTYGQALDILESAWFDVFGSSFMQYRNALLKYDKQRLASQLAMRESYLANFSPIDWEVFSNPDKLKYKFVDTDVSPEIIDMFFTGVPLAEATAYFKTIVPPTCRR